MKLEQPVSTANLMPAEQLQRRACKAQEMCAEVKADLMKVIEVFWQEISIFAACQCISRQWNGQALYSFFSVRDISIFSTELT